MEYIGIPNGESLEHYGVKGAKWGYNKGKKNGKRTAAGIFDGDKPTADDVEYGYVVSDLQSMNNFRRNRSNARLRNGMKVASAQAKAREAKSQWNRRNANAKDAASIGQARAASRAVAASKRTAQKARTKTNNLKNATAKDAKDIKTSRTRTRNRNSSRNRAMNFLRKTRQNMKNA